MDTRGEDAGGGGVPTARSFLQVREEYKSAFTLVNASRSDFRAKVDRTCKKWCDGYGGCDELTNAMLSVELVCARSAYGIWQKQVRY